MLDRDASLPVLGTAGASLCDLMAEHSGDRLWLALAYAGFFLNLFNLIPLRPLDGGRVVSAVLAKLRFIGLPVLGAVFLWRPSPMRVVIALLALPEVVARLRGRSVLGPRQEMAWPAKLR